MNYTYVLKGERHSLRSSPRCYLWENEFEIPTFLEIWNPKFIFN